MPSMPTLIFILFFLCALLSYPYLRKKSKGQQKRRAMLPPGSMGWPFVGETLQLYSQDPNDFFTHKQTRYGNIFKTHILGCPCVMLASPEATRFVLVTHAHLFKPTYPKSKEKMIGPFALFFHQGNYHTNLRKLVQNSFAPEAVRKLVPGIEAIAISALESWASTSGQAIHTFHEMKKFSFEVGILSIFGHLDGKYMEELEENYCILDKGYNSFPTNLPGTAHNKAILARKRLGEIVSEIICERREKDLLVEKDLLGHLLNFKNEEGRTLSEDQISDNIIGVLFAAQDTTASVLTWILKYLHDDQKLLEAVKAEQKMIYESNDGGKRPLTWAQTRKMPITHKVILESLRMASIVSFTFREAVVDVEYEGYLIPKGWKVVPKPNTFMPFGTGVHACPGNELAKLEMLILIHHLVTKFRWEVVGSQQSGVEYGPFPVPRKGLPLKCWKESNSNTNQLCI
ncbi:hypothetical protein RHMOL_Rhmol05G0103300 [Rhododendron molle]|uniref:Uncharacterized protein n=1 Tax=Rhododendron molle TaxID=49168 RepID=A0ACC0NPI9_RHOML|nr:hypothetical protein RHMOL_Rhmol05G0103300 [Rhododendron molle]